jgi:SAM-dependent MidA family methyltransferase
MQSALPSSFLEAMLTNQKVYYERLPKERYSALGNYTGSFTCNSPRMISYLLDNTDYLCDFTAQLVRKAEKNDEIFLLELGAGDGIFMRTLLDAVRTGHPEIYGKLHCVTLDFAEGYIGLQEKKLKDHSGKVGIIHGNALNPPELPYTFDFIVANEFFDDLPCIGLKRENGGILSQNFIESNNGIGGNIQDVELDSCLDQKIIRAYLSLYPAELPEGRIYMVYPGIEKCISQLEPYIAEDAFFWIMDYMTGTAHSPDTTPRGIMIGEGMYKSTNYTSEIHLPELTRIMRSVSFKKSCELFLLVSEWQNTEYVAVLYERIPDTKSLASQDKQKVVRESIVMQLPGMHKI